MSLSDMYLLAWASIATVAAVYYHQRSKHYEEKHAVAFVMLIGLMEGTARMIKKQNGAVFVNEIGDEVDEISIKNREG